MEKIIKISTGQKGDLEAAITGRNTDFDNDADFGSEGHATMNQIEINLIKQHENVLGGMIKPKNASIQIMKQFESKNVTE